MKINIEYSNYLAQTLKSSTEVHQPIFEGAKKALELNDYIFLNEIKEGKERKGVVLPSIAEGEYILIYEVENHIHIAYEKTAALKLKQPFKSKIESLSEGDNEIYGLNNLFKFTSKERKGISLYFEKMYAYRDLPEIKAINLEKNPIKQQKLMKQLTDPAGKCVGAMTTLDMMKSLVDTLASLKLMKKYPDSVYSKIAIEAAKNVQNDSASFVEKFENIYSQTKEGKFTGKNSFVVDDYDLQVWNPQLSNSITYEAGSIGYLIQKIDNENWNVYPYSKEYVHNNTLKEVINKIKDNTIIPAIDMSMQIKDGKIEKLGAFLYEMSIDLDCIEKDFKKYQNKSKSSKNKIN